jgi:hypothetical protein
VNVPVETSYLLQLTHLLEGTPKEISKTADTGKTITSHFCPDCGTTLFRTGDSFPGKHIIKAGVLDSPDWPNKHLPQGELYAPERISWLKEVPNAAQMNAMS